MLRRSIAVVLLSAGLATVGMAQGAPVARSTESRTDVQKELQQVRQELRELRALMQQLASSMQQEGQPPAARSLGGMGRVANPAKAGENDKPVATRRVMGLGAAPGPQVAERVVDGRPGGMAVAGPRAPQAPQAPESPRPARIGAPSGGGVWSVPSGGGAWVMVEGEGAKPVEVRTLPKAAGKQGGTTFHVLQSDGDDIREVRPEGFKGKVFTTTDDGTVRIWSSDGKQQAQTPAATAKSGGCCGCCCCCQCCGNKAQQAQAPTSTRTLFVAPEEVRSRNVRGTIVRPEGTNLDKVKVLRLTQSKDDDDDDDDAAPAAPKQIRVRKVEAPSTTNKQRLINI